MRELAPMAELVRQDALPDGSLEQQVRALCKLLGIRDIAEEPRFAAAARRHNLDVAVTRDQKAWLACARRAAVGVDANPFAHTELLATAGILTRSLLEPAHFAGLPSQLASVGVRLVHVEPFKGNKISGVAFLLDDDPNRPVIALSGRGDRLDKVIFTLLHEIAHVVLRHPETGAIVIDEDGTGDGQHEIEANELAASWVFPHPLDLAVDRCDSAWVRAEAARQGVHPILLVGRLQSDRLIPWRSPFAKNVPSVIDYLRDWGRTTAE